MVSMAEASANAVGEWKLKEVWRENEAEPLSITRDGTDYIMSLKPHKDENKLRVTIKVGNSMSSTMSILESGEEEDKIERGKIVHNIFANTNSTHQRCVLSSPPLVQVFLVAGKLLLFTQ